MSDIKLWFEPLLWIIATITILGGFVRFCKPVWKIVQSPKEMTNQFQSLREDMNSHFDDINTRLDGYDRNLSELSARAESTDAIQLSLIRNEISNIYHDSLDKGFIPENVYRTVCDMHASYKKDGGNSYIDAIMEQIHELYKETQENKRNHGDLNQ